MGHWSRRLFYLSFARKWLSLPLYIYIYINKLRHYDLSLSGSHHYQLYIHILYIMYVSLLVSIMHRSLFHYNRSLTAFLNRWEHVPRIEWTWISCIPLYVPCCFNRRTAFLVPNVPGTLSLSRGVDSGWSGWATAYPKPAHRTTSPPKSI